MLGVIQGSVVGPGVDLTGPLAEEEVIAWIDGYADEAGPAAPPVLTVVIGSSLYLLHIPALDRELAAWDYKVAELSSRLIFIDSDDDEPEFTGLRADLYRLRKLIEND